MFQRPARVADAPALAAARVRIGRVTMKAGGADLRILHPDVSEDRAETDRLIRQALDAFSANGQQPAGFGFVAWSADWYSVWTTRCGPDSPIPDLLVADFVGERIRSGMTADLAISQVNRAWGAPPRSG